MKPLITTVVFAAITLGAASLAAAQSLAPKDSDQPTTAKTVTPSEAIARQPTPETPTNLDQTNRAPGVKGPMEGGGTPIEPDNGSRVISPKEGPGVQNPGVGPGINGSSPAR